MSQAGVIAAVSSIPPQVPTSFPTNSGTATPSGNVLNVLGIANVFTSAPGSSNTIDIQANIFHYTNVTHAMSPYTVLSTDYYISVDCSAGTVTLRFPNTPFITNQTWVIKDRTGSASTNNISVTTVGGAVTIDGATTYTLNSNYSSIQLLGNSTPTYEVF